MNPDQSFRLSRLYDRSASPQLAVSHHRGLCGRDVRTARRRVDRGSAPRADGGEPRRNARRRNLRRRNARWRVGATGLVDARRVAAQRRSAFPSHDLVAALERRADAGDGSLRCAPSASWRDCHGGRAHGRSRWSAALSADPCSAAPPLIARGVAHRSTGTQARLSSRLPASLQAKRGRSCS